MKTGGKRAALTRFVSSTQAMLRHAMELSTIHCFPISGGAGGCACQVRPQCGDGFRKSSVIPNGSDARVEIELEAFGQKQ
jgi:hypothetical protein